MIIVIVGRIVKWSLFFNYLLELYELSELVNVKQLKECLVPSISLRDINYYYCHYY